MSTFGTVSKYLDLVSSACAPVAIWMDDNNIKGKIKMETPSAHLLMDMQALPVNFMGYDILWVS